jgi:hypothetical protein
VCTTTTLAVNFLSIVSVVRPRTSYDFEYTLLLHMCRIVASRTRVVGVLGMYIRDVHIYTRPTDPRVENLDRFALSYMKFDSLMRQTLLSQKLLPKSFIQRQVVPNTYTPQVFQVASQNKELLTLLRSSKFILLL